MVKNLRTILGRILSELDRVVSETKKACFNDLLERERTLYLSPDTGETVYSLHEPDVEVIAKGKIHKKFEFGNNVSVIRTRCGGFILGCKAFYGNPYDGNALEEALADVEHHLGGPNSA